MYDELVATLRRQCVEMGCGNCNTCVNRQAAEAIEELQADKAALNGTVTNLLEQIKSLGKLRWIPVTERLPDGEAERYLVAAPLMALGLRVSICYYAENLEEVDEYDFKDKKHSGFYGYDDEYGYYERSGVRYWMPLPQPPEEE